MNKALFAAAAVLSFCLPSAAASTDAEVLMNTVVGRAQRSLERVQETPVEFGGILIAMSYEGIMLEEIGAEEVNRESLLVYLEKKHVRWLKVAKELSDALSNAKPESEDPDALAAHFARQARLAAFGDKAALIVADVAADRLAVMWAKGSVDTKAIVERKIALFTRLRTR